jgi:hypothetical protein
VRLVQEPGWSNNCKDRMGPAWSSPVTGLTYGTSWSSSDAGRTDGTSWSVEEEKLSADPETASDI